MSEPTESERTQTGPVARSFKFLWQPRPFGESVILGGLIYVVITVAIILLVTRADWELAGLAFVVVFASAVIGSMAGFIFGVPKFGAADAMNSVSETEKLVMNTNLGRVSDWLTTIVVGLGIAQFEEVLEGMRWLGEHFGIVFSSSDGLSNEAAAAFGISLVLASAGIGFVMMYMWTSIRLPEVFRGKRADPQIDR